MKARRFVIFAVIAAAAALGGADEGRGGLFGRTLTDAQEVIADTQINHGDMTIVGSVDREDTTYDPGKPIILSVKTSKAAHVAILRVLANGDTTLLFPNKAHPKSDIAANTALTVPGPDDAVTIAAPAKPQIVLYEFIASTATDSWLFSRGPDKGSDFADLGVTTRAIAKNIVSSAEDRQRPRHRRDLCTLGARRRRRLF